MHFSETHIELALRHSLFDTYQQLSPRKPISHSVVVVQIDEDSLKKLGQWPWPRSYIAQIINNISAQKPAAIGVDILFPEADRLSPQLQKPALINAGIPANAPYFNKLPNYDVQLAEAISHAPVALGVAALANVSPLQNNGVTTPMLQIGDDASTLALHFSAPLRSIQTIDTAAQGHGLIIKSESPVLRQIPALARIGNLADGTAVLMPNFAIEVLRIAANESALAVRTKDHAIRAVDIGKQARIPTDANGLWWLYFSNFNLREHISASSVYAHQFDAHFFTDRIVLIGFNTLVGGVLGFIEYGYLIDLANPIIFASLVFIVQLAVNLSIAQQQERHLQIALQKSREQQLLIASELNAAKRIQMGMLPNAEALLKNESRIEVAATMQPARSIGGDFYGFCLLDTHRIFFIVGDVSGKGLPASLFMALTKSIITSAVQLHQGDPAKTLIHAAEQLGTQNPEALFVSLGAGLLDLQNGHLTWCNAGHEYPLLLKAQDASLHSLRYQGGPALGVVDDFPHQNASWQLAAGDTICIVTDGMSEAINSDLDFYGADRLQQCLQRVQQSSSEL
ncbi:unnamed protein product [Rotaria magnacalcarata]|uniref:Uncharacterized protein n=1 Tax=Rotaria magnacalcarata TaxID=392030 RepID=A0A819P709_9BILA|nr:unnamed protein product [Rotaria magnacalcarata]